MKSILGKSRWRVALAALVAVGFSFHWKPSSAQETEIEQEVRVVVVGGDDEDLVVVGGDDSEVELPKVWIGIMLKPIEGDLARFLGTEEGILIDKVMDDSPAAEAGLQEGDVLVSVDGEGVSQPSDLMTIMGQTEEGDKLKLKVNRQGESMEVRIVPALRPKKLEMRFEIDDVLSGLPEGVENTEEVKQLLEQLRAGGGEKMNVFSFGGPAFRWSTDDGEEFSGEMSIKINQNVNGENMEIQVQRSGDDPATITVTRDGETEEYTEDEMDELPEEVAETVEKLMKKGKGSFRIQSLRGLPQQLRAGVGEGVRARVLKDIADQYRDRVIQIQTEDGTEMAVLLETVEALKKEIEQLKSKLDESGQ